MQQINLFQFIVPLTFLAIWALTSIFNREAQPLPPRAGRPPGPDGPKPSPPSATLRPVDRRPAAPARPSLAGQDRPPLNRPPGRNDGIVILESGPRQVGGAGSTRPSPAKRTPRGKAAPAPASKRAETPVPRALTSAMGQSMAPLLSRPSEQLKPLSPAQSPLLSPEAHSITKSVDVAAQTQPPADLASGFRQALRSPSKVRESLVVSELLGPPVALRRGGRRPR